MNTAEDLNHDLKQYVALPTIRRFHESPAQIRCIVGPVGSGKTSGASWEVCFYLPHFLFSEYGIKSTRWVVVRNTYAELRDTTMRTVFDWFPWGHHQKVDNIYTLVYPEGIRVEILFRSCDRPDDVKKFKSLEITGYWIDESIEIAEEIKLMLKNRIGRYPRGCPVRFGIETTNPPDVEHPTYSQFAWDTPPPGPIPHGKPLANHAGFWQPPGENNRNLRPGYYDDLRSDYAGDPEWIEMYIDGKPGMVIKGKLIYNNFDRAYHVAKESLIWSKGELFRGWDNSGNIPACVVCQMPQPLQVQVLAEYYTEKENIQDFTERVKADMAIRFPNAECLDWGDPAGENEYSARRSTTIQTRFTSNAQLMRECGVDVKPSEQNFRARVEAVERALRLRNGLLIDPGCTRLINGFLGGYCYPEIGNTGIYGEKPIKNKYSHCLVGETLVSTPCGAVPIQELSIGDFVITPMGPKSIIATMNSFSHDLLQIELSDGRKLICTHDHPFITDDGFIIASALQYGMVLKSINTAITEKTLWEDLQSTRFKSSAGNILNASREQIKKAIVLLLANQKPAAVQESTTRTASALSVNHLSAQTNIAEREHAPRVVQISSIAERRRVYDLTVDEAHCFYANGILVGNCHDALQYVLVKILGAQKKPRMTAALAAEMYRKFGPPMPMEAR